MIPEPVSETRRPRPRRLLLAALVLIVVIAAALFGVRRLLLKTEPEPAAMTFAPAQEDEFLIVIAPFLRAGGDPQAVGGVLANDLRLDPAVAELYRVETLPRAPLAEAIPGLLDTFAPNVLVTGQYDGVDIDITVDLRPPEQLPPPPAAVAAGGAALIPDTTPVRFQLFAPQNLEKPLGYLQAWILGQSYFWQGAYDEALPPLKTARSLLPRQAPVDKRTGMDQFAANLNWQLGYIVGPVQGNWQAARDLFRDALRQAPQSAAPALGLAAALAQLNDVEQAGAILRQALRDHPDSWQIHFALAEIALQQGDTGVAFTNYERAISLLEQDSGPTSESALADVYVNRGYYRLTHDDPEAALSDLQQALDLGRDDAFVQGNLGWAAYLVGEFETAIRASAAARQLAPGRPDLAFNEALHLLAAGQTDAARVAYGEAIDLTLTFDDTLSRSTFFGVAYNDLDALAQRRPDLAEPIREIQERIDIANG